MHIRGRTPRLLAAVWAGLLLAGCLPGLEATVIPTPTPNPTLLSISVMLTQTRAAPTITPTFTLTPTRVITPSPTVEIPVIGSPKLPAPASKPFEIGDTRISLLTLASSERTVRLRSQKGSTFLDLEVAIENTGEQVIAYNPLDFRLVSQSGSRSGVEIQPAVDALSPVLLDGELGAGEWVRGHVAFSVPADTAAGPLPYLLHYRPALSSPGGSDEAWFDLSGLQPGPAAINPAPAAKAGWPGETLPGLGARAELNSVGLTIAKVEVKDRLDVKADKDQRFVILSVKIENTASDKIPFNAMYFRIKDQNGFEYQPYLGSPETSLQAGSLGRGKAVSNIIIFQAPAADRRLLVTYQPTVLFAEYRPIRFLIELPLK